MAYSGKHNNATTESSSSDTEITQLPAQPPVQTAGNSRPNINSIISGHARAPYDFESFVDFLSRNHCIETLDFLSEANAYSDAYYNSGVAGHEGHMTPETRRLGKQWKTMMSTYISTGSPNELNIPENMRKELLDNHDVLISPPKPVLLESTIHHARELLADGVLIPFINSIPMEIRSQSLSLERYHPSVCLPKVSEGCALPNAHPVRPPDNDFDRLPRFKSVAYQPASPDDGGAHGAKSFQKWWRASCAKLRSFFRS